MITYEPIERRAVASELARILRDSDQFLLDDVMVQLDVPTRQRLSATFNKYNQQPDDSDLEDMHTSYLKDNDITPPSDPVACLKNIK